MALSFLLVLAATVILIRPETPVTKVQNGGDSHQRANECSVQVALICSSVNTLLSAGPTSELT